MRAPAAFYTEDYRLVNPMGVPKVLVVAEKPKIAEVIAYALCYNPASLGKRRGRSTMCPTWEFDGLFQGFPAEFRVTSTYGHIFSVSFAPQYGNWATTNPADLFDAEVVYQEVNPDNNLLRHLAYEAQDANILILCLDNDNEGENIAFEVIGICKPHMNPKDQDNIYRAKFSAVTADHVIKAFHNLVRPNKQESDSVRTRQIIDLRAGCAFTRFQTRFFQEKYGDLDAQCISYGPGQTPTLFLCVERLDRIMSFQEQPYYTLAGNLLDNGNKIRLKWNRGHVFDKSVIDVFHKMLEGVEHGVMTDVVSERIRKPSPMALNTVTMLKEASSKLGMGPQKAMNTADYLYINGYISYPRTDTDVYPASFDWLSLMNKLHETPEYYVIIESLKRSCKELGPHGGVYMGDHPPITPVRCARHGVLRGDEWRMYDLVVRHFLASIAGPYEIEATTYTINISSEDFSFKTTKVMQRGYTNVVAIADDEVADFQVGVRIGDICRIRDIRIEENMTEPPALLSEAELLEEMEYTRIGTDASMATHVHNIVSRNYVKLLEDRRIQPTKLGRTLLEGYMQIDPELVLPSVRATIENYCAMIAKGKVDCNDVLQHVSKMFKMKFDYYVAKIDLMDSLFATQFTKLDAFSNPLSRCGVCNRVMIFINMAPVRIVCSHCSVEYPLPNGGNIRLYRRARCRLDNFELLRYHAKTRSYLLCPMCYNRPPVTDISRNQMGCVNCARPSCPYFSAAFSLTACPRDCDGTLTFDVLTWIPNCRFFCTRCLFRLYVSAEAKRMSLIAGSKCIICSSRLACVTLRDRGIVEGCLFCSGLMKHLLLKPKISRGYNNYNRRSLPGGY